MQDLVPILSTFIRDFGISFASALASNRWIKDIIGGLSALALAEYLKLWDLLAGVSLAPGHPDRAVWRFSDNGMFSTSSAYGLFFAASARFACAKSIWKSKALTKCNFFLWLAVHKRCPTADNLAPKGWPHNPICALCSLEVESCTHLFVHCRFTEQVWHKLRVWSKTTFPVPSCIFYSTEDWWIEARRRAPKALRRDFDTFVILVHWRIWKET